MRISVWQRIQPKRLVSRRDYIPKLIPSPDEPIPLRALGTHHPLPQELHTFDGTPLPARLIQQLKYYSQKITNPYGIPVEFVFLDARQHDLFSPVIRGEHLYVVGKIKKEKHCEEAKKIESWLNSNSDYRWKDAIHFRDFAYHNYPSTDCNIIWEIISEDIPRLLNILTDMLCALDGDSSIGIPKPNGKGMSDDRR